MTFDDDLRACAGLVRKGDPDRFMAAMAAPVEARRVLFPIYALTVEVARAPWVTQETMIAEIRLQWWRDALDEIATGGVVRRHEVVTPLARVISPEQARELDGMVAARHWDIYREPFESEAGFTDYIDRTSATPMWVAARVLGAADESVVRDYAYAAGLANWLCAVPELRARGRVALLRDDAQAVRALARDGLERLARARARRAQVSRAASAALLVGWQAETVLRRVVRDPRRVDAGTLGQGEMGRRLSLMRRVVTGRW